MKWPLFLTVLISSFGAKADITTTISDEKAKNIRITPLNMTSEVTGEHTRVHYDKGINSEFAQLTLTVAAKMKIEIFNDGATAPKAQLVMPVKVSRIVNAKAVSDNEVAQKVFHALEDELLEPVAKLESLSPEKEVTIKLRNDHLDVK